ISTRRSNGTSWFAYASRSASRTRPSSSRKLGSPDTSARSTSVLTKNPTSSSIPSSVLPATAVPSGMSSPAPSLVSSAATPACTRPPRPPPLPPHEPRRPRPPRQPPQRLVRLSLQLPPHRLAPVARHRRPRAVGGQLQDLGQAGQGATPVRHLASHRALLVG